MPQEISNLAEASEELSNFELEENKLREWYGKYQRKETNEKIKAEMALYFNNNCDKNFEAILQFHDHNLITLAVELKGGKYLKRYLFSDPDHKAVFSYLLNSRHSGAIQKTIEFHPDMLTDFLNKTPNAIDALLASKCSYALKEAIKCCPDKFNNYLENPDSFATILKSQCREAVKIALELTNGKILSDYLAQDSIKAFNQIISTQNGPLLSMAIVLRRGEYLEPFISDDPKQAYEKLQNSRIYSSIKKLVKEQANNNPNKEDLKPIIAEFVKRSKAALEKPQTQELLKILHNLEQEQPILSAGTAQPEIGFLWQLDAEDVESFFKEYGSSKKNSVLAEPESGHAFQETSTALSVEENMTVVIGSPNTQQDLFCPIPFLTSPLNELLTLLPDSDYLSTLPERQGEPQPLLRPNSLGLLDAQIFSSTPQPDSSALCTPTEEGLTSWFSSVNKPLIGFASIFSPSETPQENPTLHSYKHGLFQPYGPDVEPKRKKISQPKPPYCLFN